MYPSNKKKKVWREEKERLLKMTLEERRKEYLRDYIPLNSILSWKEEMKGKGQNDEENTQETSQVKKSLTEKVSLYRGDITLLEVDAIVNAANASLLGGGGVDGCIHRAAGPCLLAECRNLNGCDTGHAKITCGYDLPAKYVIHTVGPIARGHINGSHKEDLANCYKSSLKLVKENNIRSVAFPCISTGIYGFPNEPAAVIALNTIKEWLAKNHHEVDRIIFCVFLEVDFKIYKKKMNEFFSVDDNNEEEEDVEMKEDSDENGPEEKQSVEEMEEQSQDADGVNTVTVPGPASEEAVEDCKDEDFAKDENITKGGEVTDHSVRDQDHPDGQENDSTKNEIKIETESQSSYMETEELSSNQEDAVIVEQPEVIPLTEDQEEKEGEKAPGEDTPRMPGKSEGSSDLENTPGPDAGAQDEAKEQRNGTK
ncbi:mono-ADP ribosylhydrolase 2 [Homo sapiens]|uniref:ADP-ribose glycohydrolase MACROD2 n=2 Tax=Homo sapiens TaxID=9606 RepID=MACD2_HUMAN|nr:ADP-ribose glycohydrolase MACROD2 isoform 1 [Homo sapiens]A1Z1Q3.2 RecName: Full=ADP-ribose glycohydrolase MACROD2; AltName: Full=MACRO domain-containing protein 2; AltName: Full=O-acetyl-ADP-ribose deacetylase MACROD2; AltName: Full=[Protein ADP-ribosylaspartate] hydrolase MACROD2; AltName: Full=[Protein ADP-ribosylglutamate] hydrolase MACROD2 [Homo sapiens]KAI2594110.1 mono-ADP ribosylhydrolase 2 [Homo sapiens]KAI4004817.1 mono-ADP ribosylhydrolase 2 [Homo sapiens]|eukprot:NP_542407.2 ADP-ribose glycohydrolase MACROD2 isoform 1 [Homo sapiens]